MIERHLAKYKHKFWFSRHCRKKWDLFYRVDFVFNIYNGELSFNSYFIFLFINKSIGECCEIELQKIFKYEVTGEH